MILYAAVPDSVPVIGCSPPSRAAQLALLESGLSHEVRWLRFDEGEHRTPQMVALSGTGTVPVLVDGDVVLTDTLEILEHVAARDTTGALTPGDPMRARLAREVKGAGMAALRARMARDDVDWAAVHAALSAFATVPAPEHPDIADLLAFAYLEAVVAVGCPLIEAIGEWRAAMHARSSVRQTRP